MKIQKTWKTQITGITKKEKKRIRLASDLFTSLKVRKQYRSFIKVLEKWN